MTRLFALAAALLLALPLAAAPVGDDGLHKPDWLRDTFRICATTWKRRMPRASAC